MNFLRPVPKMSIVTQTYDQHVSRAKANGWCYKPGNCLTFYFGGIDLAVRVGTPVLAAQAGQVTIARADKTGYGTHVRIQHAGGYLTVYGHLSQLMCKAGDTVKAGDVIGLSGSTGNSTGPHLHFEARRDNVPFDPAPYLVEALEPVEEPGEQPAGMPQFPKLPTAVVTAAVLNVRNSPGVLHNITGQLKWGEAVEVIRARTTGEDIWLEIGYKQFVAMKYDGQQLMDWE